MNLASIIILLLVVAAVWYALRTLHKNGGHTCSECRKSCNGGPNCTCCKAKK